MNERIRLLAEQAGSTHKQNLGVYQFYTDELEKFAQLIVDECVRQINNQCFPSNSQEWCEKGAWNGYLVAQIREHFGVEE